MYLYEAYWLAGLLEGEGCFSVHRRSNRRPYADVRVQMTDEDVVQKAASLMECAVNRQEPRVRQTKPTFTARLTGAKAAALMKELRPMMGTRRGARIDEILQETS